MTARLALVLSLLVAAGCDQADDDAGVRVHLRDGAVATFRVTTTFLRDGQPDSTATGTVRQAVLGVNQTVEGIAGLTQVETVGTGTARGIGVSWYRDTPERLEDVAYRNDTVGPIGLRLAGRFRPGMDVLGDAALGAVGAENVTVRPVARIVAEYPLEAGQRWTHFDLGGSFRSDRVALGDTTVQTPLGPTVCARIRTTITIGDQDEALDWIDCLDDDGLVVRDITYLPAATGTPDQTVVDHWVRMSLSPGVGARRR